MRYVVVGTGSVGVLLAVRLAAAGQDVVAVARSGASGTMAFTVVSPRGRETVEVETTSAWDALTERDDQVMLLAVKCQDTATVLARMTAAGVRSPVVCVQNGVDNERQALRVVPHVFGGLLLCPVIRVSSGVVRSHASPSYGVLDVGRWPAAAGAAGSPADELAVRVVAELTAAQFSSRVVPDIARWKYAKLLSNVLNAVDATCGWEARDSELAGVVVDEARRCVQAAGLDVTSGDQLRERAAGVADYAVVDGAEFAASSTTQSLARQTGSVEVDFLNGEICLLGRLHGVATPANELLQRVCTEMSAAGRPPGGADADDLLRVLRSAAATSPRPAGDRAP